MHKHIMLVTANNTLSLNFSTLIAAMQYATDINIHSIDIRIFVNNILPPINTFFRIHNKNPTNPINKLSKAIIANTSIIKAPQPRL